MLAEKYLTYTYLPIQPYPAKCIFHDENLYIVYFAYIFFSYGKTHF